MTEATEHGQLLQFAADLANSHVSAALDGSRSIGPPKCLEEDVPVLQEDGINPREVISQLHSQLSPAVHASISGRYFSFVTGGSFPVASAADVLVTGYDQNSWSEKTAPATARLEQIAVLWLKSLLTLPQGAEGVLCGGCTVGNTIALACARDSVLNLAGWDVASDGLQGSPPVSLYVGEEAHSSVFKAARIVGLGGRSGKFTTVLPCKADGSLDGSSIQDVPPPSAPAILVLQAGHVNTGSFDDFQALITWAKSGKTKGTGVWVHVDGAFGLWAGASEAKRHLVKSVQLADSWATDLHKVLNVPYDNGLVVVRDGTCLYDSMSAAAPYLDAQTVIARPLAPELQNSRRARGVVAYATLRSLGRNGVEHMVDRFCNFCCLLIDLIVVHGNEQAELLNPVCFNQALIRFADSDDITQHVAEEVQKNGHCWVSPALYKSKVVIRLSVCCWKTTETDIKEAAREILECACKARKLSLGEGRTL